MKYNNINNNKSNGENKIKEENSIDMGLFEKSNWFNNKVLFIISLVIMSFSSFISVFAVSSYLYNSNEVSFNNSSSSSINSSNVQGAIDELYADAHNYEEMSGRVAELESYFTLSGFPQGRYLVLNRNSTTDTSIRLMYDNKPRGIIGLYGSTSNLGGQMLISALDENTNQGKGVLNLEGDPVKVNGVDVVYKAGDKIIISGYNVYAGRLGWSRGKVIFTIPINKPIIASGATVSITSPINIYAQDSMKSCSVGSIEDVAIKNNGAIVVRAAITPSTAWSSTGDSIGNVEISNGMTITFK